MCPCLRKQEARLLCACSCVLAGQAGTREYFLDCRLRGNDKKAPSLGLLCRPASPTRGEAICFIRLTCYENKTLKTFIPKEYRKPEHRRKISVR